MFTGIVEEKGRILSFDRGPGGWRLVVGARLILEGLALGDSVAVNGCCLTTVDRAEDRVAFDVLEETRRLTGFFELGAGSAVNLERSLSAAGRLGGHFVTGHVDGVGRVEIFEARGADHFLRVRGPAGGGRYMVHKGSIAVDGVSLTVAEVDGDAFSVWLIPHTLAVTSLGGLAAGAGVNLELDVLAKYVEKLVAR